jgi:DNA helicase HerA-like ATPase
MSPRAKSGIVGGLTPATLDERVAIVGTSGSGKTYAAKGLVELLLTSAARICVVDPLGVWWGLRSSADGITPGFPVIVFGGRLASPFGALGIDLDIVALTFVKAYLR